MSTEQKHKAIRDTLASLGYYVRNEKEKGYALYIAAQVIEKVSAA